jgi:HAD superfamily hydrolase (TIGR01509 family)
MLDLSRIRALCFDVDGTLRDTDNQYVDALARRLRWARFLFPAGDPAPFARKAVMALESPGTFLYSLPDRLGIDLQVAALSEAIERRLPPRAARHFTLIPGARETLIAVGRRYPLAIVSARDARNTLAFLRQFDLEALFVCVATALTCRHAKPFPDQIVWAAQQMGVSPSACLMIGDTTVDVRAGRAAGAQTVGVLCGFGEEKELRRAGADVILPGTADLPALLQCAL